MDQLETPDDRSIFNAALSDVPVETKPEATQAEPRQDNRPRDEQGRFAPKAEDKPQAQAQAAPVQAEAPPKPEDDKGAHVPAWRLKEEADNRREAESRLAARDREFFDVQSQFQAMQRQLAELQKPKNEPPDFFSDPNAAIAQSLNPIQEQFAGLRSTLLLNSSKAIAIASHGKEAVTSMEQALNQAMRERHPDMPMLSAQMRNSDDPVGLAMNWYQRDKLLKETGGDLTTFKTKLQDDLLKDPTFLAKAIEAAKAHASGNQNQPRNVTQLPPSLNKATSAAPLDEGAGSMNDAALFRQALR